MWTLILTKVCQKVCPMTDIIVYLCCIFWNSAVEVDTLYPPRIESFRLLHFCKKMLCLVLVGIDEIFTYRFHLNSATVWPSISLALRRYFTENHPICHLQLVMMRLPGDGRRELALIPVILCFVFFPPHPAGQTPAVQRRFDVSRMKPERKNVFPLCKNNKL